MRDNLDHLESALFLSKANGTNFYAEFWSTRTHVSVAYGHFADWKRWRNNDDSGLTLQSLPRVRGVYAQVIELSRQVTEATGGAVLVCCGDDDRLSRAFWLMLSGRSQWNGWKRFNCKGATSTDRPMYTGRAAVSSQLQGSAS